ncbi:hypothetical protein MBRA1_003660 [Malassezia brasiliensis]|uniref:Xylanolytic transcriptional activator regulatory domain-containing protein n=1 Tax=Malassezia brasiliensis TaxID=1821822 RepID=A0AAF0DX38_9BASI|nr:hypothetical protein MBRA1_003660 [Malassezia brasiliensis]
MDAQAPAERVRQSSSVADVVSAALTEPPKKKRQCDRKIPCQPCIDRGTAELCHPYGEGDEFGNLHERVRRLEVLVQGLASDHKNVERHLAWLDGEHLEARSGRAAEESSVRARSDATETGARAAEGPSVLYGLERVELKHLEKGPPPDECRPNGAMLSDHGSSWFGELALPSMSQRAVCAEVDGEQLEVKSAISRSPASERVERLIAEGGAPPNIVRSLMRMLPPKEECDVLFDTYFVELNYIILPVHEPTFRLLYNELMQFWYGGASSSERRPSEGARLLPYLTTLFFFFAHSALSLPDDGCSDNEAIQKALRFFHAGRRALEVASFIRGDHIDLVLANLFASKFCILLRRTTQVWMYMGAAVRGALSVGLHRDGSKLGLDQVTTERRRRLWATLYHWDKVISILVARPSGIQDAHCDTLPPSDVSLDDLSPSAPAHPSTGYANAKRPSPFLFAAMRYALGRLMGQIGDLYQDLRHPVQHEDVMRLDRELEQFRESLPSFLRTPDQPGVDLSLDKEIPNLSFHRYLIHVELNFTRITLHRPYVLRSDPKYRRSREIAFQVAHTDMLVRKAFDEAVPEHTRSRQCKLGGLYRLFNTALIYGIMLLLERDPARAAEQKAFLEEFVAGNRHRTDLCSRREVTIVQMFLAKAQEPRHASKRRRKRSSVSQAASHAPPSAGTSTSTTPENSQQSWEGSESAQSFLTNLGGFNKALSLFPPGIANEMPLQHDNTYSAPPLSLDVNGLDLFRSASDAQPQTDITPFDQRLAMYEHDTFEPYGIDFQGLLQQPSTSGSGNTPSSMFPQMSTAFTPSMDAYNAVPPQQQQQQLQMDSGIMPWGGFINAIVPQSP